VKQVHVLLVEDNDGDILITREAMESAKLNILLSVVNDGKEAIDFIGKKGKYTDVSLPDLILLDVNLPKKNGHEVLKIIKEMDSMLN